jgi:D-beta-D-heptose 7-phosphate kinase/D-beta-D-heptose 1-phosphate adenosyltransferase
MTRSKIKAAEELSGILSALKKDKKTVVFTNGCFDILHMGHAAYLEEAKKQGDLLVIGLNSDSSVRRLKGAGRPLVNQDDRAGMLASLQAVDYVTIFDEDDPGSLIKKLDPDIIVKGSDWRESEIIGGDFVKKRGGKVMTIPFLDGYSTSALIEKIKAAR